MALSLLILDILVFVAWIYFVDRAFKNYEKYGMAMWISCLILNIISTLTCFLK